MSSEQAVRPRKRLISEEPRITMMLRSWKPIFPRPLRDWWLDLLEDVETLMRSREYVVSTIAGLITQLLLSPITRLLGMATTRIRKRLGVSG